MTIEEVTEEEWHSIGKKYNELFHAEEDHFTQEQRVERYDEVFDLVVQALTKLGKLEVDGKVVYPSGTIRKRQGLTRIPGKKSSKAQREEALKKSREDIQFLMSRWVDMSREITIIPHNADFEKTMEAIRVLSELLGSLDRAFYITFDSVVYLGVEQDGRITAYSPYEDFVQDYVPSDLLVPLPKA